MNDIARIQLFLRLLGNVKIFWRMFLASIPGMAESAQLHSIQFEESVSVREYEQ